MIKNNGVALIVASVVLGGSVLCGAMINKGLILQAPPKENIVTTTVGHVDLGKVYSESRGMDITLNQASDKSTAVINLTNVDPNNFSKELQDAFVKLAKEVNDEKGLSGDKAIKPENLSGNVPFKLNVKTYMQYSSEHMPVFTLTIKNSDVIIDKNEQFEPRVITEVLSTVKESTAAFALNSFINTSSHDSSKIN